MSAAAKKVAFNVLYIAIVIGICFAAWAIGAAAVGSEFVLPGIGSTFVALGDVLGLGAFWQGLGGTLLRCLMSYAISLAIAGVLFFVCTVAPTAAHIADPLISALRTLPTMAVSLILAIWAGAAMAPVVLGVLVIAPMLYSALRAKTATLPTELIEVARIYGAGRCKVFFYVILPYAASALPESLSTAFSFNIKIVIAAEILMQTASGIGILMYLSQAYYRTATLIALVFVAVVVSVALEYAVRILLRVVLKKYIAH